MAEPAEQIDQGQHAANAINVHMASYYTENPAAWFSQIDSAFINARITSSASKFHLANSAASHLRLSLTWSPPLPPRRTHMAP